MNYRQTRRRSIGYAYSNQAPRYEEPEPRILCSCNAASMELEFEELLESTARELHQSWSEVSLLKEKANSKMQEIQDLEAEIEKVTEEENDVLARIEMLEDVIERKGKPVSRRRSSLSMLPSLSRSILSRSRLFKSSPGLGLASRSTTVTTSMHNAEFYDPVLPLSTGINVSPGVEERARTSTCSAYPRRRSSLSILPSLPRSILSRARSFKSSPGLASMQNTEFEDPSTPILEELDSSSGFDEEARVSACSDDEQRSKELDDQIYDLEMKIKTRDESIHSMELTMDEHAKIINSMQSQVIRWIQEMESAGNET